MILLAAISASLFSACSSASSNAESDMRSDLSFLASDALEGRMTGSSGAEKAAEYIASRFKKIGLSPEADSYQQTFERNPKSNPHVVEDDGKAQLGMKLVNPIQTSNVVGKLAGKSEETVIIGAHYDHLGFGGEGSLSTDSAIHNGADDNASGIAVLLALAESLKEKEPIKNYLFVAFSGEEQGLWGSNYFTNNASVSMDEVDYMLNMDMVGRMDENTLAINGTGTTAGWLGLIDKANSDSLTLVTTESGVGPSDHTSFYNDGVPVLHFFTGQHEDYHKPSDDVEKINFEGMLQVHDLMLRLIIDLDDEEKLVFQKTKDQNINDSPAFKVTLGVIPDYMFSGEGMRIDGISDNRPAFNAGLQKGDVVQQMGEIHVVDMQTYMEALNQFEPGDSTEVTVSRGAGTYTQTVIFD